MIIDETTEFTQFLKPNTIKKNIWAHLQWIRGQFILQKYYPGGLTLFWLSLYFLHAILILFFSFAFNFFFTWAKIILKTGVQIKLCGNKNNKLWRYNVEMIKGAVFW